MTPAEPPLRTLRVGTRTSGLALMQTGLVVELIRAARPGLEVEVVRVVTRGDRTQAAGVPLPELGAKGLFTAELEQGLRAGSVDLAVHSLKDLPTEEPAGITIGAVCLREDPRDALVTRDGATLASLRRGALVGTGSVRRTAQLLAARPDLRVVPLRGNVDTRVGKVRDGELDAAVLALAGLLRLGLDGDVGEVLPPELMLPAPGQGTLAVQCRLDDPVARDVLAAIDDVDARAAITAERVFLGEVGGGCSAPVGALAESVGPGIVSLRILVASPDGRNVVREEGQGDPVEIGRVLAGRALAAGAGRLLAAARRDPPVPGALSGVRIAVTRPREQGEELAAALAALGAEPVFVPAIRIEPAPDTGPLDAALATRDSYDWVVFTSANGVAAVRGRLEALGLPLGAPATTRVAAVGPATAAAVRELGVEPAFVPAVHRAEEIPAGLGAVAGTRILLPQAEAPAVDLASLLRARGATVDAVVAYRTVAVALAPDDRAALARGIDVLLLASGSAARAIAAAASAHEDVRLAVDRALGVCIGPRTADAARQVEFSVGFVVEEHTTEGLIRALLARLPGR